MIEYHKITVNMHFSIFCRFFLGFFLWFFSGLLGRCSHRRRRRFRVWRIGLWIFHRILFGPLGWFFGVGSFRCRTVAAIGLYSRWFLRGRHYVLGWTRWLRLWCGLWCFSRGDTIRWAWWWFRVFAILLARINTSAQRINYEFFKAEHAFCLWNKLSEITLSWKNVPVVDGFCGP